MERLDDRPSTGHRHRGPFARPAERMGVNQQGRLRRGVAAQDPAGAGRRPAVVPARPKPPASVRPGQRGRPPQAGRDAPEIRVAGRSPGPQGGFPSPPTARRTHPARQRRPSHRLHRRRTPAAECLRPSANRDSQRPCPRRPGVGHTRAVPRSAGLRFAGGPRPDPQPPGRPWHLRARALAAAARRLLERRRGGRRPGRPDAHHPGRPPLLTRRCAPHRGCAARRLRGRRL